MALNPISFTENVVADFLRYQLTTYPLADEQLHAQLKSLLQLEHSHQSPLRQGPFVSISRPFRAGAAVESLVAEGIFHPGMRAIVPYPVLRAHQEQAIRHIRAGYHTLVATGTGSGKTESFLYPIISRCLELEDAKAPPGIVAILIYPMNALAEDQLERLRGLLAGRRVPFGLYVGKTPEEEAQVRGQRLAPGHSHADYQSRLRALREAGDDTTLLPLEERASRESMRRPGGAPRILLTNIKQLELLLTRSKDIALFDRAPLEFVVFDEAHTFRGAQGAETACLLRRLRTFCGRSADQVVHVATSATMADPLRGEEAGRDFARRFFGVEVERVRLVGEVYDELRWNPHRGIPVGPVESPHRLLNRVLEAVDLPSEQVAAALSGCLVELGGARLPHVGWQKALAAQLVSNELVFQLSAVLDRPRTLPEVQGFLRERLGREVSDAEVLCWLALGAACGQGGHDPLLRPVLHSFIRGVGGAVVTFTHPTQGAQLWLAGEDAAKVMEDAWQRFPLLTCTTCGQHYYEAHVQDFHLFLHKAGPPQGGELVGRARLWPHLDPTEGGCRVLFVDRLVVRPDEDEEETLDPLTEQSEADALNVGSSEPDPLVRSSREVLQPSVRRSSPDTRRIRSPLPSGHDYEHRRLHPLWLCTRCGAFHGQSGARCLSCQVEQPLVAIQAVRSPPEHPGVLHACVACQAPGRRPRGGRYREPARPVRASAVSDVHVIAQSMLHLSEHPRLLIFADNRQDAAFQAGWMRDHARRFRLRAYLSQLTSASGSAVGDLVHALDGLLEKDRELSRALIPEVWQVVHADEAGTKHREERLYFLRILVLRELATGVKQRLGLEPWGRLKVEYQGLHAGLEPIMRWAEQFQLRPEALCEGIAALLDHHRRQRMLSDPTRVFENLWSSGQKEVMYGYLPASPMGPKGLQLRRSESNIAGRVTQWMGSRATQVSSAVASWGIPAESVASFLEGLWELLVQLRLLVRVSLQGWGKPLPGSEGAFQLNAGLLRIKPHRGRWRCEKCRRMTIRTGPTQTCLAWRCQGRLVWEEQDQDDFDLHILDRHYRMLRVMEHSAQVPEAQRERIENLFKGQGDQVNTLVCTPTLELGVDIGGLDAVLMRNVPPGTANYWQRAGRAGRRHRMAVDITYAQATGFDQAYFRQPLKLLGGMVEVPRFNLRNREMIRKHVHATVLTCLHALARRAPLHKQRAMEQVLTTCLPSVLRQYLFHPHGEVRAQILDLQPLATLVAEQRTTLLESMEQVFTGSWPAEDADAVTQGCLADAVDELVPRLQRVIERLKRRLDWALGELNKLSAAEARQGVLDPEDQAHRRRCQTLIRRLKGLTTRSRQQAQGGADDSDTLSLLAFEGFLPGYGLETGSIIGTAEVPRMTQGLQDFELPRPPALALREFVPGNAIYANGFRFVPRRFELLPEEPLRFQVDAARHVVRELGMEAPAAYLGQQELRAVPICHALLTSQSQISDEEEFRFQMPVAVYAYERQVHRGGQAFSGGGLDYRLRRALQLRMVNAGPRSELLKGHPGYTLCLACGQSLSPFASQKALEEFTLAHQKGCQHTLRPTGFYSDVEVDVLGLHGMPDQTHAFSMMEAIRLGASRVLDMEVEDLQLLAIGHPVDQTVDVLLYDPMPGGSGLLDELVTRWPEVVEAAQERLSQCSSACERSCIDCLQTYRNRFYHAHLDRHAALMLLGKQEGPLEKCHAIPELLPKTQTTSGQPQTPVEQRLLRLLQRAGFPPPQCQHKIQLSPTLFTIPDFFYPGMEPDEPGTALYVDGMAEHLHGNPAQAEKDFFLREQLRSRGYEVLVLKSFELEDRSVLTSTFARLARYLFPGDRERQRQLRQDTAWWEDGAAKTEAPSSGPAPLRSEGLSHRPVLRLIRWVSPVEPDVLNGEAGLLPYLDLSAAAGGFSDEHLPAPHAYGLVEGLRGRTGLFLAQVVGDSMNKVAPSGSLCVWEHLRAGAAGATSGQYLLMRQPGADDPEYGRYTFKQLVEVQGQWVLRPCSTNALHKPHPVDADSRLEAVARFVSVVQQTP